MSKPFTTIEWIPRDPRAPLPGAVRLLDQTRLPLDEVYIEIENIEELYQAIRTLKVRGAPAIGIAAAFGLLLAAQSKGGESSGDIAGRVMAAADFLAGARPTAVNLFAALDRMRAAADGGRLKEPDDFKRRLAGEAFAIMEEDINACRAIGEHGLKLLRDGARILTHCNAGALATARYGTALAPIHLARERGMRIRVFVDETRPLLQGARLTAWELTRAGVEATLICDNTAAWVMRRGMVDAVFTGADRIAANGDTANKIGTYGLAVLARAHNVPFYVFAPLSTFDGKTGSGDDIVIEERSPEEVTDGFGRRTAPEGMKVFSPAFDVTPAGLVTAFICERGEVKPPFART